MSFVVDRLKVHLRAEGVRHDLIAAAFSQVDKAEDDLVRLLARVDALGIFLRTDDGANLLVAYRRAANIVAIEERKDKKSYEARVAQDLLREPQEVVLAQRLDTVDERVASQLDAEFFESAMIALATLRQPVDEFFERVTVNVDDTALRENRLRLLSRIRATMNQVADFSQIEG